MLIACNHFSLIHAHFGANFTLKFFLTKPPTIVFDFRHKSHTYKIIIPTRRRINPPDKQTKINIFYINFTPNFLWIFLISYQQTLSLVNLSDTAVIGSTFNLLDKRSYIILHICTRTRGLRRWPTKQTIVVRCNNLKPRHTEIFTVKLAICIYLDQV